MELTFFSFHLFLDEGNDFIGGFRLELAGIRSSRDGTERLDVMNVVLVDPSV